MFTIDLLKGKAIPLTGMPGGLAIMAMAALAPIAAALGMFTLYQNNQIAVSVREKEIATFEAEIGKLSGAVELQDALQKEKMLYGRCLSEVKSSISSHKQWSPVLTELMENIPDSVMLTSLEIKHGVSGGQQSNPDEAVKDFMNRLWACDTLRSKLEKIGHSQEHIELDGQQLISYEISCVFKPGL
jgi:Tfp pilus assembly protein PilN